MMQPLDKMSLTSNQSSVLSQKPSVISATTISNHPMASHIHQQPVLVQQQMLSQQELLNQQMLQMQQLQMANQQRLHHQSQPVLVQQPLQQQHHAQRPLSQQVVIQPMTTMVHTQPIQAPVVQQMTTVVPQKSQQQINYELRTAAAAPSTQHQL